MNAQKPNKKKLIPVIGFFVVLVILLGVLLALNSGTKNKLYGVSTASLKPATQELLNDPNYQQIIKPEELQSKIGKKENFFVYYFASDCVHCRATTPKLMPLSKQENITMHEFNLREYEDGWDKYKIEYTPTLIYYEKGVEKERMVGGLKESPTDNGYTLDDFKAFFEKYKKDVTS
ncbi:thioredoxin family protein [Paenibacillus sp. NPDC055715]